MTIDPSPGLPSRRAVLAGIAGLGATGLLAACGANSRTDTAGTTALDARILIPRFDPGTFAVAGVENRLVLSVVRPNGDPVTDAGPLTFAFAGADGSGGSAVTVEPRGDGIPVPYYPVRFTPPRAGTYTVTTTIADRALGAQPFTVGAPGSSAVPAVGATMPPIGTPTVSDPAGVDPVCTRIGGPCPLHERNLRDVLEEGRPAVLLVSTPRYCQIGVCGPVLDLVVEQVPDHPSVSFVHAEVYRAPDRQPGDPRAGGLAPVVEQLGLDHEPSLFVVRSDGTVAERLDYIFDRTEIAAAVARAA